MPIEDRPYSEEEQAKFRTDCSVLDEVRAQVNEDFQPFASAARSFMG
ncbi:MAG: hypothetical protein AAF384_07295 [Pseudomonadota bacterium]